MLPLVGEADAKAVAGGVIVAVTDGGDGLMEGRDRGRVFRGFGAGTVEQVGEPVQQGLDLVEGFEQEGAGHEVEEVLAGQGQGTDEVVAAAVGAGGRPPAQAVEAEVVAGGHQGHLFQRQAEDLIEELAILVRGDDEVDGLHVRAAGQLLDFRTVGEALGVDDQQVAVVVGGHDCSCCSAGAWEMRGGLEGLLPHRGLAQGAHVERSQGAVVGQGEAGLGLGQRRQAGEFGQGGGHVEGLAVAVGVEPGQAVLGVVTGAEGAAGVGFAGHRQVLLGVQQVDEAADHPVLVPGVEAIAVLFDHLPQQAAVAQAEVDAVLDAGLLTAGAHDPLPFAAAFLQQVLEAVGLEGVDGKLEAAVCGQPGQLLFHGVAGAQGHGDELADAALADVEAVEPFLVGGDDVVLGVGGQAVVPRLAGEGVDLAGGDLDGAGETQAQGLGNHPPIEAQPQGFGLVEGHEDAAMMAPGLGQPFGVVVDQAQGEFAQARGQGVDVAVVGDAQGAVEGEVAAGLGVDVREAEAELVVAQGQHGAGGSWCGVADSSC